MSTRREFVQATAIVALANTLSINNAPAATQKQHADTQEAGPAAKSRAVRRIRSASSRGETLRRIGGGGAFPCLTWGADDQQLLTVVEGAGWPGLPKDLYAESALVAVSGTPENATFQAIAGYPVYATRECFRPNGSPVYANSTALSVDGSVYVFFSASGDAFKIVGEYFVIHEDRGSKLIYSPDNGRTWRNVDGSAPVVYESATQQSKRTMAFWKEPQNAFEGLSFVQMGKDYQANSDGYIYVYGPHGIIKNGYAMFRVAKSRVLDHGSYEYFSRWQPDGGAQWSKEITERGAVQTFPHGTSEYGNWNFGGVVYNEPLGVYMMIGWIGGAVAVDYWNLNEFVLPKNVLGLWTATNPWGPWTQVVEIDPWFPGGDYNAKVISLAIAPKWIAEDGKSFWVVWQDLQHSSDYRADMYKEWYTAKTDEEATQAAIRYRRAHPQLCFNTQRVDVHIA
jgi:Domain of unknown function (DUF4185)